MTTYPLVKKRSLDFSKDHKGKYPASYLRSLFLVAAQIHYRVNIHLNCIVLIGSE